MEEMMANIEEILIVGEESPGWLWQRLCTSKALKRNLLNAALPGTPPGQVLATCQWHANIACARPG